MSFMTQIHEPPVMLGEPYPLFSRISLETHSTCNRKCVFCPVSTGRRDGIREHMAPSTFVKIAKELRDLEFEGTILLFLLNEPLINPRIYQELKILRHMCPKSTLYLSTNGDVLAKHPNPHKLIERLRLSGLSALNLNVYDSGEEGARRLEFYERLVNGSGHLNWSERGKYTKGHSSNGIRAYVTDMRIDRVDAGFTDVWYTRTKDLKTGEVAGVPVDNKCPRPHRQLVIRYDAKVLMCCALDPTMMDDVTIVGDVSKQTMVEAWNSDAMRWHRWRLQEHGRRHSPCDKCNMKTSYPGVFRRVEPKPEWLIDSEATK